MYTCIVFGFQISKFNFNDIQPGPNPGVYKRLHYVVITMNRSQDAMATYIVRAGGTGSAGAAADVPAS